MTRSRFILILLAILWTALFPAVPVSAGTSKNYTKAVERYDVPDVTLIDQDGKKVRLKKLMMTSDKPLLVDFIYTTCTTICPVLSANFVNFQRTLGAESGKTRLISLSIDPEHDTPKVMKAYLNRYQAKPGWDFLTGSKQDMNRVIRAFNALGVYSENKMEHYPLILMKAPARDQWTRIYGLIGTTELIKEYEEVRK